MHWTALTNIWSPLRPRLRMRSIESSDADDVQIACRFRSATFARSRLRIHRARIRLCWLRTQQCASSRRPSAGLLTGNQDRRSGEMTLRRSSWDISVETTCCSTEARRLSHPPSGQLCWRHTADDEQSGGAAVRTAHVACRFEVCRFNTWALHVYSRSRAFGVDMTLREALLIELDLESPFIRRTLERVPLDKRSWKPHEKSMISSAERHRRARHLQRLGRREKGPFPGLSPEGPARARNPMNLAGEGPQNDFLYRDRPLPQGGVGMDIEPPRPPLPAAAGAVRSLALLPDTP